MTASSLRELPVLGVGASLSLEAEPDPVSLVRSRGGPSFVEYAGRLDVNEVRVDVSRVRDALLQVTGSPTAAQSPRTLVPVLFHPSYINFCGSFANDSAWLAETARHIQSVGSPWFAQDCAYCFVGKDQGYSAELGYFVPPILNRASLERAVERVSEVQRMVGVPVAIEPPPMSFTLGRMPLLSFFGELAERTDCALLLDVGHLHSYELASGNSVRDELSALPVERVIEMHVAGGRIEHVEGTNVYIDAHERDILPDVWALFSALLPRLPSVRAVCFECEGTTEGRVLGTLAKLRELVVAHSSHDALVEKVRAER